MPRSHQIDNTFFVGELVSHNDYHRPTDMTTLEMVITYTMTSTFGRVSDAWGPPLKTCGLSTWNNIDDP